MSKIIGAGYKITLLTAFYLSQLSLFTQYLYAETSNSPCVESEWSECAQNKSKSGMPPVVPGEEVSIGEKKMRVWSTGGELSKSELKAPNVPPKPGDPNIGTDIHLEDLKNLGVIVDRREEKE